MSIRFAQTQDLATLVDIYNQAIAAGQRTGHMSALSVTERVEWFQQHPAETHPIFVEEENGMVVGYLSISAYRPGRGALRHTAEVSFYVDFAHHRRGIATQLLRHAIKLCPELQIRTLIAILMETNTASIECFKKFGFENWGLLPSVADYDGLEIGQVYYGHRIV